MTDFEALYTQADTAHYNDDLDTALDLYTQAVALQPDDYDCWRWMGDIYLEKSEWDNAIDAFVKAYNLNPQDGDMLNDFALCYYENEAYADAILYYKKALHINPDLEVAHRNLGIALYELYRTDTQSAREIAHWWRDTFPTNPHAMVMAAAILGENVSEQNADYVQGVFDDFAEDFESKLHDLDYKAPDYIADALHRIFPLGDVLDAGCGTGLVGDKIAPMCTTLTGVDLSGEMLKIAKERGIYTHLHQADLNDFLRDTSAQYNAIVAGDVLCYFGDLQAILTQFYKAVSKGGIVIFTLEYDTKAPYFLTPSGRYTHDETTTRAILENIGFTNITITHKVLRTEHGNNVDGIVVTGRV